jgi:hypothetical protein
VPQVADSTVSRNDVIVSSYVVGHDFIVAAVDKYPSGEVVNAVRVNMVFGQGKTQYVKLASTKCPGLTFLITGAGEDNRSTKDCMGLSMKGCTAIIVVIVTLAESVMLFFMAPAIGVLVLQQWRWVGAILG